MIKSTTTIAGKSLFITAIAFLALIIAVMINIPDAVFIGILLTSMTSSAITAYLIEKETRRGSDEEA